MSKNTILSIIVVLQFLAYFMVLKFNEPNYLLLFFLLGVVAVPFVRIKNNDFINLIVFSFLFIFFGILSQQYSMQYEIYNILSNLFQGVFTYIFALSIYSLSNAYQYVKRLFIAYLGMLSFEFINLGISNVDAFNHILAIGSRNIVSAICLCLLILLLAIGEVTGKRVSIFYPVATFVFCSFLYGKSGIILSFLILFFFIIRYFSSKTVIFTFFILFLLLLFNYNSIYSYFIQQTNFSSGLESAERLEIIKEYINAIENDGFRIFFGVNIKDNLPMVFHYGNNPHNSFLNGHILYGLFHTIFFIILFFYIFIKSNNLLFSFLTFCLLIRYSIDTLGLFSPFDVSLFYIFIVIKNKLVKV